MIKHRTLYGFAQGIAAVVFASTLSATAHAENSVVVELYTSQGCSSCPAADAVLKSLKNRPNVIALSLNVDYWDYLGWKDDLALPGNTTRQRKYAKMMRSRHVYTPQLMVDGKMDVIGSRRSQVDSAVESFASNRDEALIDASINGGNVSLAVSAETPEDRDAIVWLVGYDDSIVKDVGGGENRGRSIEYSNVVREWRQVGRWNGKSPLNLEVPRPSGQGGIAVIVQEGEVGPILGATQVSY